MQRGLEPTNREVLKALLELNAKVDLLVTAAKEGGGLVPQVDYSELRKMRKKLIKRGFKVKCKKQCKKGPCRYGASQALKCLEQFEKGIKLLKKRKLLSNNIPYTEKQLNEFMRRDLLVLTGIIGINMRKVLRKRGEGNQPIIDAIIKHQPKYLKRREKINQVKLREKEIKDLLASTRETVVESSEKS